MSATSTSLPGRPIFLPAKIATNPAIVTAGSTFTVSVTLNAVAQNNVTVNLSWKASGFISPFSGPTPPSLTVLAGQTVGTTVPVSLIALASGSFTITATTPDGSNSLIVSIQPAG
jgi:hypothetical protein